MKLTVYFENEQSIYPIKYKLKMLIRRAIVETLAYEQYENDAEVSVTLTDSASIQSVNHRFRGIDAPTDVLSFPMMEFSMPEVYVSLGNIILSVETARRQAEEYGHSLKRELCFLCAHSALHLLGYDHETEDEREEMEAKQREILDALGIKR